MSHDETPPSADPVAARTVPLGTHHHPIDEAPLGFSTRARSLSWIIAVAGVLLVIALVSWLSHRGSGENMAGRHRGGGRGFGGGSFGGRPGANQPTTVGTIKVTSGDLPIRLEELGTVTPTATVTVIPQVSGTISKILFEEGQTVKAGQVLAMIDPRPYQAQLLQAQGALIRDKASLVNAQLQLKRDDILAKQDSIAQQDRDTQASLVEQLKGTVAMDQGQVQAAQINLDYTRITSPVTGRIGLRTTDVGNYIAAGSSTGIAVVTTLDPIDVQFSVAQQDAPAIQKRVAQGATIPAIALDASRTTTLDTGKFLTLDNRVSTTTGTISGKARFANANFQLYPMQFVNVRLTIDTIKNAITVPPSAIRSGPDGSYVWLLNADRTVSQRPVKTGVATSDRTQILAGLQVGDTVVTDGGDRLTDGARVALPGDKPVESWGGGPGGGRYGHHRRGQQQDGGASQVPSQAPTAAPQATPPAAAPQGPAAPAAAPGNVATAGADQTAGGPGEGQHHGWWREHGGQGGPMANMTPEQRRAWWRAHHQDQNGQGNGQSGPAQGNGNGG